MKDRQTSETGLRLPTGSHSCKERNALPTSALSCSRGQTAKGYEGVTDGLSKIERCDSKKFFVAISETGSNRRDLVYISFLGHSSNSDLLSFPDSRSHGDRANLPNTFLRFALTLSGLRSP